MQEIDGAQIPQTELELIDLRARKYLESLGLQPNEINDAIREISLAFAQKDIFDNHSFKSVKHALVRSTQEDFEGALTSLTVAEKFEKQADKFDLIVASLGGSEKIRPENGNEVRKTLEQLKLKRASGGSKSFTP